MDRGSRVPDTLTFVVHPDARQGRFLLPTGIAALVFAAALALVSGYRLAIGAGDFTDMMAVMFAFAMLVTGTAVLLARRTVFRNGPVLGANRSGLWLAVGGLLSPVVLHFTWTEVTTIGVRYVNERRKRGPRLGVTLTDEGRAELDTDPRQKASARKSTALFQAAITIDAQTMDRPLEEVLRSLRKQAPRRVEVETPTTD
ncbi:hypothetical protein J4H86_18105 [Spiractinospora alimapuensis]|uniref:hypothetical protein n=1 Tax=Spiractinospora alimapuensis TaxID=2820884 RepID=UPI001F2D3025|nr:hypothetical protein [Spiractinospora alimapuensis]QVQ50778.1 hypothetical protein J4H86_18105 [Spiractinospora alimapuensis]